MLDAGCLQICAHVKALINTLLCSIFPHTLSSCSCLAYRQEDRLDVAGAAAHPYLQGASASSRARERRQSVSARDLAAASAS